MKNTTEILEKIQILQDKMQDIDIQMNNDSTYEQAKNTAQANAILNSLLEESHKYFWQIEILQWVLGEK